MNVFKDGRLEFSNNLIERAQRAFVQGRKGWLFSATPRGASASSICYSIVETAKENELKPYEFLEYLLGTISNRATDADLTDLLPWSSTLPENIHLTKADSIVGND
jgi:hypothetical protein